MATKQASVLELQEKLNQLYKQQRDLESQRDQQLLSLLHKTNAHQIDPLILTGALLDLHKTATDHPSKAEVWRQAGETFLYPNRKSKGAKVAKATSQK